MPNYRPTLKIQRVNLISQKKTDYKKRGKGAVWRSSNNLIVHSQLLSSPSLTIEELTRLPPGSRLVRRCASRDSTFLLTLQLARMTESMGKPVSELRFFGTRGSPAAYTIRDFLQRSDVPFRWVELTTDEQARTEANVEGLSNVRFPSACFRMERGSNGRTVRQVTETLGCFFNPSQAEYDLAIYGGGPAGLSTAVAHSEGLKTVLIERSAIGGQASTVRKLRITSGFPVGFLERI